MGELFKLISLNVKGANSALKRRKILWYLKQKNPDLAFLQETHLEKKDSLLLQRDWVGKVLYSAGSSSQRGVAILVRKNFNIKILRQQADEEGRWIAIEAELFGIKYTLMNVYAPTMEKPGFFVGVSNVISGFGNPYIILGGDFNNVREPIMDKTYTGGIKRPSQARKEINTLVEELDLVDVWRYFHPSDKQFTFYSNPHNSYSRIDYFLISKSLISITAEATIGTILISDHAPVGMVLRTGQSNKKRPSRWRFNTSLLKDEYLVRSIRGEVTYYWLTNEGTASDPAVEWDAFKAVIRGRLIQICSFLKKTAVERFQKLEIDIKNMESRHAIYSDHSSLHELSKLRLEYNSLLQKKVEYSLFRSKQKYYEQGERTGRFLAQRARQQYTQSLITGIQNDKGELKTDDTDINNLFVTFYQNLYKSDKPAPQDINTFLSTVKCPTLSQDEQEQIGADVTLEEIKGAIQQLQSGKSPGEDGLPAEFYKAFSDLLAPRLLNVYNNALSRGCLPDSMQTAIITLIHKKDRNPQLCGNYRPVSLINVDAKLLAKILATRLEGLLPKLIHPDQVGFIKNRTSSDNLRRLLHLMWQAGREPDVTVALSLDAEKAFDRVEFPYLFQTLEKFGLGNSFINWIRLLYHNPKASVVTNGRQSTAFQLHRGTRQGCPLSPLLFALALEPLAIAIRQNNNIVGIKNGSEEHKLLLYADDILLLCRRPSTTVSHTLTLINSFSLVSGYKINWSKSEAMPLSKVCPPTVRKGWQFSWQPSGLTYLGIKITPQLNDIMDVNLLPLIQKIELILQNWTKLGLSLLGKINILKMIIVPKVNYISNMLPLNLPRTTLTKYNKAVYGFLWAGKKPYVNQTKLYAAPEDGGLGLPHIAWYHYAFCLKQLSKMYIPADMAPSWVSIEGALNYPYPAQAAFTQTSGKIPHDNPLLAFSQETWQASHKLLSLHPNFTLQTSIWHNKYLKIGKRTFSWPDWVKLGIVYIGDLFEGDTLFSFEQLRAKYGLPKKDFWKYLQLRSCILSHLKVSPLAPATELHAKVKQENAFSIKASGFYSMLRKSQPPGYGGLKKCWERDLGEIIPDETWGNIIKSWYKVSREMQTRLMRYKIMNRIYWTPSKMARLGLRDSDVCWRCNTECGTLLHMLYSCPMIDPLWSEIVSFINNLLTTALVRHPLLCLLGVVPQGNGLNSHQSSWCRIALITGCRIILRHWKTQVVVSMVEWFNEMSKIASYEKLCYRMINKEDVYVKIWGPYLDILQ